MLIQGAQQCYAEFLYADNEIQWIKSDGKDTHLPDAPAQAGFVSNDGRSFTLLSSGREEIMDINRYRQWFLLLTPQVLLISYCIFYQAEQY